MTVGLRVVGTSVGTKLGDREGFDEGTSVGLIDGINEGTFVGPAEGMLLGGFVTGDGEGCPGVTVGDSVLGSWEGFELGRIEIEGLLLGINEGHAVGGDDCTGFTGVALGIPAASVGAVDVGEADGSKEGVLVGEELGVSLDLDGADVGVTVGNLVVGESVTGEALGEPAVTVGDVVVGADEVGGNVGLEVGCAVGRLFVGVAVGLWVGIGVGWFVGTGVGPGVGRFVGGLVII